MRTDDLQIPLGMGLAQVLGTIGLQQPVNSGGAELQELLAQLWGQVELAVAPTILQEPRDLTSIGQGNSKEPKLALFPRENPTGDKRFSTLCFCAS